MSIPKTLTAGLKKARDLISDPENWTTEVYARSKLNRVIGPGAPGACKFCSVGAMLRVYDHPGGLTSIGAASSLNEGLRLLDDAGYSICKKESLSTFIMGVPMVEVNDKFGHDAVMEMYDIAVTMAEKAGV